MKNAMKNCMLACGKKLQKAYKDFFNPDNKKTKRVKPKYYDSITYLEARCKELEKLKEDTVYKKAHYDTIGAMVKKIVHLQDHHKDEYSEADIQDVFQMLRDAHKEYRDKSIRLLPWEPKELDLSKWGGPRSKP